MRPTPHADFALRLSLLVALKPDKPHTVEETGTRYRILRGRLTKVSRELIQAGFVEKLGYEGMPLARSAHHINLGAVLHATEENPAGAEYFGETWRALYFVLEQYSPADLISRSETFRQAHAIPAHTMH